MIKKKKIVICIIVLAICVLGGILGWYYYPRFLSEDNKQYRIMEINNKQGNKKAEEFIDRAYDEKDASYHRDALIMYNKAYENTPDGSQKNGVKITGINIENKSNLIYLTTTVKNIGFSDINYIKYNIYYYGMSNCQGDIIGTEWGNSNNPLPSNANTTMETIIKPPNGTVSYKVVLDEIN